jgi:hypothetical protein
MIGDGGSMEIYTIIPVDEILSKGVPYVRFIMDEKPYQNIYNTFWNYFVKTWVIDYDPKIWNINAFTRDTERLINRTNNPVERYHRHLNEILPAHPSVPILVETLQKEGRKYVEYLSDLKLKKAYKPKPLQAVVVPPIPTSQWYQN